MPTSTHSSSLRHLPSVEKAVQALGPMPGIPRPLVVALVREEVERMRAAVLSGEAGIGSSGEVLEAIGGKLERFRLSRLTPVINGTGVLIHTNLGRSPLGESTGAVLSRLATSYSNLEIDLISGERGPRAGFLERALAELCRTEAATAVNNCAAALVLILKCLANGERNEVVISRGELVEIGGGFRVPEILEASGAKLREVGATNKTHVDDYAKAIGPRTGMILKVHRSNFYMEGFVDSPETEELAALARRHGLPIVEDLGSGAVMRTDQLAPIEHEPTPWEILAKGVDLVCFSGDKLLGGPQAGVIAGREELVRRVKREPFFRAVRCDKLILTVLQETVAGYLEHGAPGGTVEGPLPDVPVLEMLRTPLDALRRRAEGIVARLPAEPGRAECTIGEGTARCGGGTMPKSSIPSITIDVALPAGAVEGFARSLRLGSPPVVGYVADDRFRIDLRTVFPRQDDALVARLAEAIAAVD